MNLHSGTAFGVLVFSQRRRRSPLSLRPPATIYQPFGLRDTVHGKSFFYRGGTQNAILRSEEQFMEP
jgi:hypothetical protein